MDISALSTFDLITETQRLNRQISKTDSFQSVLENAAALQNDKELKSACQEFEAYFVQMMLREMRKTVDTSASFVPKNNAQKIFEDMLDEEYAAIVAKSNKGIGLAEAMYKQMRRDFAAAETTAALME